MQSYLLSKIYLYRYIYLSILSIYIFIYPWYFKIDFRRSAGLFYFRWLSAIRKLSIVDVSSILAISMHSDDEPRKRTARACDSCYRRKVSILLVVNSVTISVDVGLADFIRLNATRLSHSANGAATMTYHVPMTELWQGKERQRMMVGMFRIIAFSFSFNFYFSLHFSLPLWSLFSFIRSPPAYRSLTMEILANQKPRVCRNGSVALRRQ